MKLRYGLVGAILILGLAIGGIATAFGDGSADSVGPNDTPTQGQGFVGMKISAATDLADDEDRPWRIGRQDDESFALTDDLVPGRVTFEINDGIVTAASIEQPNMPSDDVISEDPARADLIAAALKRLLTEDNSFGGIDVFDDIRVVTVIGADAGQPLKGLDLELIADTLSELGAVSFIGDAAAEIDGLFQDPPGGVAVVSVDDFLLLDDRAEVKLSLWCGSLCAVFLTYEAIPVDGGWAITGTTGPIAVA